MRPYVLRVGSTNISMKVLMHSSMDDISSSDLSRKKPTYVVFKLWNTKIKGTSKSEMYVKAFPFYSSPMQIPST